MAYWLIKTEPHKWSWDDQIKKKTTHWDGVRNFQASNNLKAMAIGDKAFFYHSGEERQILGIVSVSKTYYPDPTDAAGRFGMVDVTLDKPLNKPVTLAEIKAEPKLATLALVRQSRLSVSPVDDNAWALLLKMGGM